MVFHRRDLHRMGFSHGEGGSWKGRGVTGKRGSTGLFSTGFSHGKRGFTREEVHRKKVHKGGFPQRGWGSGEGGSQSLFFSVFFFCTSFVHEEGEGERRV